MISEKGVTVNYGLTAGCSKKRKRSLQQYDQDYGHDQLQVEKRQSRSDSESIYEFLAAFSGGQVLNLQPTDIGNLSSLISFSAARTFTNILYKSSPLTGTYMFNFPVDETATAILISVNGRYIQATVRDPQGCYYNNKYLLLVARTCMSYNILHAICTPINSLLHESGTAAMCKSVKCSLAIQNGV